MTSLVKYEAACRALAEAKAVDEVKDIRDKADAMRIYAMQAKNKDLEIDAAEIRIRAERRLGEMIALQKATAGLNTGAAGAGVNQHTPKKEVRSSVSTAPKLSDVGVSKDLSSRAQKLAAVPEDEFEAEVAGWRERVQEEGRRVTTRLEESGERSLRKKGRTLEAEPLPEEQMDGDDELAEAHQTITELAAEVDELNDRLAARNMDASEEEKYQAFTTITALRGQIKTLEEENAALKASRDTYMQKCAEMQKQINFWRKKAEKVAA